MIKLKRPEEPPQLKKNKVSLKETYRVSHTAVWRKDYIINPLYDSSNKKCAYCGALLSYKTNESRRTLINEDDQANINIGQLPDENTFLHIDHFIPKTIDENLVVEWSNLIPSCPTCNISKNKHNVKTFPIINPYEDNPADFIIYSDFFAINVDAGEDEQIKANKTLSVFKFHSRNKYFKKYIDEGMNQTLIKLSEKINTLIFQSTNDDTGSQNDINEIVKKILNYCQPHAEYAAINASILLKNQQYLTIKKKLIENKLWSEDNKLLEENAKKICLCYQSQNL